MGSPRYDQGRVDVLLAMMPGNKRVWIGELALRLLREIETLLDEQGQPTVKPYTDREFCLDAGKNHITSEVIGFLAFVYPQFCLTFRPEGSGKQMKWSRVKLEIFARQEP